MRVRVVIVNYRTGALAVKCLRSLVVERQHCPGLQAVVVDNCSGDGSADLMEATIASEGWCDWARVHRAPVNGGFSYGNNCGVRPALAEPDPPDFFWILNPDTEVRPGALRALLEFMQPRPQVGITGSLFELGNGELWPHAFRFPSIWSELASGLRLGFVGALLKNRTVMMRMGDQPAQVDWLPGASMLVRRQVFEQVGLMDEGYFLYFEETDFCLEAARAGWQCWYVPQSRVMHWAGASTGVTGEQGLRNRRPSYWFESRRRYWIKNHGWAYAAATDVVWMIAFVLWQIRRVIQRKPVSDPPYYLRDFWRHSAVVNRDLPTHVTRSVSEA